jgi:hypothetical protein
MVPTRILAGAVVLAAACVTAAPAAAAGPLPSSLTLTATTDGRAPHVVELTCDPVAGTHPDAQLACYQLEQVDGDIAHMPGTEAHIFCPMIFQPIEVSATGLWRGHTVLFQDKYTNSCERDNKTGNLFRF